MKNVFYLHRTTVGGRVLGLFVELELQVDRLYGGDRHDAPLAVLDGHVHHWLR